MIDDLAIGRLINYLNANPQIAATFPGLEPVAGTIRDLMDDRNKWKHRYSALQESINLALSEGRA